MKIKSCAWLVCLILCLPITMKAQVLKIENGMAFSSLVNEGEDLFDKSLSSYQMSIGLDYLDQVGMHCQVMWVTYVKVEVLISMRLQIRDSIC